MKLFDSGKWIKTPNNRATELFMKQADKETLMDGIRYLRNQIEWLGVLALLGIVGIAILMGYAQGASMKWYNNEIQTYKATIYTAAEYMCKQHNDMIVSYDRTESGHIVAYCANGTYSI